MNEINDKIFDKLKKMAKRFDELEKLIVDQDVINDTALYTSYIKEVGCLSKIVDKYRALNNALEQKREAEAIINDEHSDKDLQELAKDELKELVETEDSLFSEIKKLFLTENKESMKSVIAEIRAGTGGDEAALFAADLYRMYTKFAEDQGWKTEIFDCNATEKKGFKEIVFSIEGKGAFRKLKHESGTHRVQRVPATESSGRVHTSTATVAILPEIEPVEIEINTADLVIDTFRSSGPGGQKVNKTSSGIRITHKPTGLVVKCQDEKSQHKNKAKAMRVLRSRLFDLFETKKHNERAKERKSQIGKGERSEKIRTYNYAQNRVTDHRVPIDLFDLENIINGSLDKLFENVIKHFDEIEFKQLIENG
ncbi:MAG: peptide chain release factor 1 [Candidatus Anammoxibacter sp.]